MDMPAISYLVEEAVKSGIEEILIITNRDKDAMEDFFDYSPEYEARLSASGRALPLPKALRREKYAAAGTKIGNMNQI